MNETLQYLLSRRSLRAYDSAPIREEDKKLLKEATLRAPTAGNMMLYSVLEIEEQSLKNRLALLCDDQPMIARAPLVWLFLADLDKWDNLYRESGAVDLGGKRGVSYRSPGQGDLLLAAEDALIAAQSAVTAAESLGIGSCYIGDILENYEEVAKLLNLPTYAFPVIMVCFGYPKASDVHTKAPLIQRLPETAIFFPNTYPQDNPAAHLDVYAEHEKRIAARHSDPEITNIGQFYYLKKYTSDFMAEMNRSVTSMFN